MKEFLFLFIGGSTYSDQSPEEIQKVMEKWMGWIGKMKEDGVYKGGNPLEDEAKTVSGTNRIVTDGPFAEAKEVVGGYIMVEASNLDEAAAAARGCPIFAEGGRVEVRPIRKVD